MDVWKESETRKLFYKISVVAYLAGLPNYWTEYVYSERFEKVYDKITKMTTFSIVIFIISELASFFSQTSLTEKQRNEQILFVISHPLMYGCCVLITVKKEKIREVLHNLVINLKKVHNDSEIEKRMIKKLKSSLTVLMTICFLSVMTKTFNAISLVIKTDVTFNAVITGWPDVDDKSLMANGARIIFYIFWFIFLARVLATYILVISVITSLSYQYTNLQSYFYGISKIFEGRFNQKEKEEMYEKAFKVGIKLHVDTLRCANDCQIALRGLFSVQIIYNIITFMVLLAQMVNSERTFLNVFTVVFTAMSVLVSTGFFMWNAGDVTVEASGLSTAMYFSGWHYCRGQSSKRIRNLVINAMVNAQKPVIMKSLSVIHMSYESYVSIVKASYSLFSVFY